MGEKTMFAPEGSATKNQVAMVMAALGTPRQMEEAAAHLGIDVLGAKLENIISGHRIGEDDADWLRSILHRSRR